MDKLKVFKLAIRAAELFIDILETIMGWLETTKQEVEGPE